MTTPPADRPADAGRAQPAGAASAAAAGAPAAAALHAATAALTAARRVVALTGAGMSAESGLATFRDAGGLWEGVDPETVATPRAYARDPAAVWRWYAARRAAMAAARPNAGHVALAALERRLAAAGGALTVVTQNIDGLHQAAGSRDVVAIHGDVGRVRCFDCPAAAVPAADHDGTATVPPRCPACGGRLRPDVVWFGEALPMDAVGRALRALRTCDLVLCIGTSGLVEPAASFPLVAVERGAVLVEVNPAPTPLSHLADHVVRLGAAVALPLLVDGVGGGA